jgi:hypothetical protein
MAECGRFSGVPTTFMRLGLVGISQGANQPWPELRSRRAEPDELRELIADAVRTAAPQTKHEEWVDARTSGLGRRQFLRLARVGRVPGLQAWPFVRGPPR